MTVLTTGIIESNNPAKGTATITHDPLGGLPESIKRRLRTIRLDAPPWNHTGRQPYAWDYCPPADPRSGYAVLTLVLDRNVRMLWSKSDWDDQQVVSGPQNPRLVLVRAQDSSLIPPRHVSPLPHQLVRGPYPWASARDETMAWWTQRLTLRELRGEHAATVIPFGNGVMVRDDRGLFGFTVKAPLAERAAFAYEIYFPQETGYCFRCVHTSNVDITGWITSDDYEGIPQVFIDHAVVHRIDQVPAQGVSLDPSRFRFESWRDWKIQFSPNKRLFSSVLDAVIGMIPVIGALYDAAQLVYSVTNGHTFWGETVALSEDEICLQGVAAILNIAISSGEIATALAKVVKARPSFAAALDAGVADAVRQNVDPRFIDAFRDLSRQERKNVAAALEAYAAGQLKPNGVLAILNPGLADKIKTLSDSERALLLLFSEDMSGFRASDLQAGYAAYLAKSKGSRLDPLAWALKQSTGRYVELFRRELGPSFRSVLQALKTNNAVVTVTPEAIAFYKKFGKLIYDYRTFQPIAAGTGEFFEIDHLVEQRFIKSHRINGELDEDDMLTLLVAKNAQISRQIPGYDSYVHIHKTVLLRDLIPNGQEDLYSVQQWWDAMIYVGEQVGMPDHAVDALRQDFKFLLEHMENPPKLDFRVGLADDRFTLPKWRPKGSGT